MSSIRTTAAWKRPPERARAVRRLLALAATLALLALAACSRGQPTGPDPDLNPTEVIAAQLVALKESGGDEAGMARAFRFASPDNRARIGPLPRFVQMIRGGFPEMLVFERAEFASLMVDGPHAAQVVTLSLPDGAHKAYLFRLSRRDIEDCAGCWLVDGVLPLSPDAESPRAQGGVI